ncbi:serine hydrolase domain-containing protein [Spongiactinospora sp. TRM90649]|uniref:serine hydrolase domain-containing protein n=1 Tax=Spongiactinospora sp. TRM90649 TaxID=3031114 RepID=UPI0023F6A144|nr:serine hydrolase domain-containing protein [Spongiactinospora sp. TRM90649]MDF5758983.1 serine hydrolase [Spongiactinospora sp. TRM90649]
MRRPLAVIAAAALTAAACSTPSEPARPSAASGAAQCDPEIASELRAWAKAGFSGSIAISTDGRPRCLAAYGTADDAARAPNTPQTVFDIGSITKAFTAAAVFALAEEGGLSLDDRAGELLPGLKGPAARATVRQLLLHTSGLRGSYAADDQPVGADAALAGIGGLEAAFPPGEGYLYSNAGYTLLALIVEKVSGTTFRSYVAAEVLRLPGGRTAGGFWEGQPAAPGPRAVGVLDDGTPGRPGGRFAGPYWAIEGNGGLAMTTRDLADWTHALFTGKIVSPASAKSLATPGVEIEEGRSETPGWVAVDAEVFGLPFLTASGGGGDAGQTATVVWVPGRRIAIAIAANRPKIPAGDLMRVIGPALLAGEPLPTPTGERVDPGDLGAIVGTYELDSGGSYDVRTADGRLLVTPSGVDAVRALFPPRGLTRAELGRHERRVLALLTGATREGRKERAAIEESGGPIRRVRPAGTLTAGGEIRTYVTLTTGSRSILCWYAVNEEGGVEASSVPGAPARLALLSTGKNRFQPDDPVGVGPQVRLTFEEGTMKITGPDGRATARRRG